MIEEPLERYGTMNSQETPRFLVVGAGALGSLFGGKLSAAGRSVVFLQRCAEKARIIDENGLRLLTEGGEQTLRIPAYTKKDLPRNLAFDFVLIMTKAYDTETAIEDARPWFGEGTLALTLQNGIGPVEIISSAIGENRVLAGTTSEGALLHEMGLVEHTGKGETVLAPVSEVNRPAAERIASVLNGAGFRTKDGDDVRSILWGKTLINAVINPITALTGLRNGEIVQFDWAERLVERITRECAGIVEAMGVTLPYDDPLAKVYEVAENTARNRSSMLQDVEKGRKTEAEYISGAFVREARNLGIEAPFNDVLLELLLSREWARLSRPPSP
jgi:2-dehydropantoate 2-reductase